MFIIVTLCLSDFDIQEYADTVLVSLVKDLISVSNEPNLSSKHVHQNVYRLHAIILSRSPFLVQLLSTSPQVQVGGPRTIYVPLEREPEVTQEGFAIGASQGTKTPSVSTYASIQHWAIFIPPSR